MNRHRQRALKVQAAQMIKAGAKPPQKTWKSFMRAIRREYAHQPTLHAQQPKFEKTRERPPKIAPRRASSLNWRKGEPLIVLHPLRQLRQRLQALANDGVLGAMAALRGTRYMRTVPKHVIDLLAQRTGVL